LVPPNRQIAVGVCNEITLLTFTILFPGWEAFLKSLMSLYKSLVYFFLMLVLASSILSFRSSFCMFLKCLLAQRLILFRLSKLIGFGFYIHCILAGFFDLKNSNFLHKSIVYAVSVLAELDSLYLRFGCSLQCSPKPY